MQKSHGHTLSEYGFVGALIAITCLGSLAMLGHSMQGQYQQISKAPDPTDLLKPIAQPAVAASPAAQSGFTLPAASSNTVPTSISDYKAVASSVQTAGANGTTKILADNITQLAKEQLAAGKITEDQANTLFALANQAYHIASIEAAIEQAASTANSTGTKFGAQTITIEGKQTSIYDLYYNLGFTQSYSDGMLNNPLESRNLAGSEMKNFLDLYNAAKSSGIMNDPQINEQVYTYSSQIASIADAVQFAAQDRSQKTNTQESLNSNVASRLNELSASMTTTHNGNGICTAGNGKNQANGNSPQCSGG